MNLHDFAEALAEEAGLDVRKVATESAKEGEVSITNVIVKIFVYSPVCRNRLEVG